MDVVNNYNYAENLCKIYVISTTDIDNIKLQLPRKVLHQSVVKDEIKLISTGEKYNGYIYTVLVTFPLEELIVTKAQLVTSKETYEVNIGRYETISLKNNSAEITSCANFKSTNDDSINLHIYNYSYLPLIVVSMTGIKNGQNEITIKEIPNHAKIIYQDQVKLYANINVVKDSTYYQIGGIIKTSARTNLEEKHIYTQYYADLTPSINYMQEVGFTVDDIYNLRKKNYVE